MLAFLDQIYLDSGKVRARERKREGAKDLSNSLPPYLSEEKHSIMFWNPGPHVLTAAIPAVIPFEIQQTLPDDISVQFIPVFLVLVVYEQKATFPQLFLISFLSKLLSVVAVHRGRVFVVVSRKLNIS